jgi:threonine/homoserine/homoserine lactone efflux protein
MIGTLFTSPKFVTFVVASLILAITPGPGVVYIVTRTLSQGRKAGFASVGGIAAGSLGNAAVASIGLAAVFALSAAVFAVVKLAGAGYLIYLGIRALRTQPAAETKEIIRPVSTIRLLRDGFFVALLNPKTALFFAALLPQFIDPDGSALAQSLILGCVFVAIALCTDSLYALTASILAARIRRRAAWQLYGRSLSAATYVGLGIFTALASPRASR